jgi:nucleoside-diphosphate-sugar epimerase
MRIFVTGASGFIGQAVTRALTGAGHKVLGLVRSDQAALVVRDFLGADVLRGALEDLPSLRRGAETCDAVIHCGFVHDFSRFAENCAIDRAAILAMGAVLKGSQKKLHVTSGMALKVEGRIGTEDDEAVDPSPAYPRASEEAALMLADAGVHAAVIRLPPSVHGDGDKAFVPMLIDIAREKRVSGYVGTGENRWSAVHRLDAASLYRLAIEKGHAGARYHAVGDEGVTVKDIATVIGKKLNLPVRAIAPEEAGAHFGFLAGFLAMDAPRSAAKTRAELDWRPSHPGLIEDMEKGAYFGA